MNTPLEIGMWANESYDETFNGFIDDLRIYNRALSESEIQQLYNAKEEEDEKPPTEISSKAVYDSKTNTLSLEGILVPFIVFELIPWSINFKDMFDGKDTSGYIFYDHKTRSVEIPCFQDTQMRYKLRSGVNPLYY